MGTALGQLVTTPSLVRHFRFFGCITPTCGNEVRAAVALGRQCPVRIKRAIRMVQLWRFVMPRSWILCGYLDQIRAEPRRP